MNDSQFQGQPQLRNPFSELPRLTKTLGIVLAASYLMSYISFLYAIFPMVPYMTVFRVCIWNIATAGFFCDSLLSAIFSVVFVLFAGKFLEPVWGSREFFKFVVVVNISTFAATFVLVFVLYFIFPATFVGVLQVPFCGFIGAMGGLTVATKQLVPNQELSFFFAFKMKAKYGPLLFLALTAVLCLLSDFRDLPLITFGTYTAWIYLRYFQEKADGSKGDPAASFSFASFFPDGCSGVCVPFGDIFYKVFVRWWHDRRTPSGPSYALVGSSAPLGGSSIPPPLSPSADREAQRQAALLALDKRLAAQQQQQPAP